MGEFTQAYQATLNSDASPFDKFMEGDSQALTPQAVPKRGRMHALPQWSRVFGGGL